MKYREANLPVRRSLFIGEDLALLFRHTLILPLHWWKLWVVACLSWLQDENTHWKNALQNNIITKHYIQQWNSVAKVMYSLGVITIQLRCAQAQGPYTLAHILFNCPCRRDQHIFIIHPLSLSSLAAHHAAIHTVASHLQALCFVWSLFCFPWISLQGAELTDLSDWCIGGGVSSAIVFFTSVQWLQSPALSVPLMWIRVCQIHCTTGRNGLYGNLRTYE